ncbi:iron complex transport system ATP-binding protein [Sulfurivirga caldicuralii]|uniref:Iron complex transport system ATP-binding protein n=1 Tax=Sulfurivirga caldicuralii TaxID=364032 RepID=A0A1N6DG36_9GAMM|nr:ATP-binding cassette domain-containing protein [Sulfurivirga caldicuralii]SIN69653.1 iron complex transport system ATP-binding protein [Sulfurivirga caldicuralii]
MFEVREVVWPRRLGHADFCLRPGELMALVGPNGAGKSSLLALMSGQYEAGSGEIRLNGQPLNRLEPVAQAQQRAWLPQRVTVPVSMPAAILLTLGLPWQPAGAVVEEVVALLELEPLLQRDVLTLSGGEQQRCQLARVMIQVASSPFQGPRFLLLDESLQALDIRHQMRALQGLRRWCRAGWLGVLWVSHDLGLAYEAADRWLLLQQGRQQGVAPPATLAQAIDLSEVFGWPLQQAECGGRQRLWPQWETRHD